jgi:hypothetical protein
LYLPLHFNGLRQRALWPSSCDDIAVMKCLAQFLGTAMLATLVSAEPQNLPKPNQEKQPGTLRISGLNDTDRVLLDGELVGDGKRIARFGGKILVNPGEYTVTIVSANQQSCQSTVFVVENRTSVAGCVADSQDELVD